MYLIGLVNFVVFKYFGDIQPILERIDSIKASKEDGYWNVQYVPFRTITSSIESYMHVGIVPSSINLIAKVVLFVPMGFLIQYVIIRQSFLKTIGISLVIILGIEITQYFANLGVADIDDMFLNLFGSIAGYFVYVITKALQKILKKGYRALN